MIEDFPYDIPSKGKTPAADHLFKVDDSTGQLNKQMKE